MDGPLYVLSTTTGHRSEGDGEVRGTTAASAMPSRGAAGQANGPSKQSAPPVGRTRPEDLRRRRNR
ncbi:hypothetical protein KCP78_18865 [Salmonella enterica subsp. enterica]|nr:hypothetical protein KCP78_18865 [Salmonella enterica subsp. enterica]